MQKKYIGQRSGFTLIELLVVLSIIGLLSSILLSSLKTATLKSRDTKRLSDLRQMVTALELYRNDNGGYPSTGGGWVSGANGAWITGLAPTYIPIIPTDTNSVNPEQIYYYTSNGSAYCIQVSQEGGCSGSPYYKGVWNNTCKLRYPDPNAVVCNPAP